ncbi:OB-fold domain-containing protein [Phenylobacterium sp. LjRoot225]|uniref:Zn-ribbon domain-containing OB-fold protein n=1 Tax=Phenylobacterium sp. LjRoot225 TaxID=3342285 RepID=UPI003ECC4645
METAPVAEGLFEVVDGVPHLIGGRRRSDGRMVFPCPGGPEGQLYDRVRLASEGVLWSFTVQRFRPKEPYAGADDEESFQPFALGYVELPGEVIVEGRFEVSDFSSLHIGQAMRLILTPFRKASGETVLAYAFTPIASGATALRDAA